LHHKKPAANSGLLAESCGPPALLHQFWKFINLHCQRQALKVVRHSILRTLKSAKLLLLICLVLMAPSCDKIKKKSHDAINKTKEKIKDKKDALIDQVIPSFDSDNPDTKFNKKRFKEFFGFAPTPDVREIYCFDDQIGIDSKFIFSFKCSNATKNKIVQHLNLIETAEPDNFSEGLWENFSWWDSAKIVTLNPYWNKSAHENYKYLWYDKDNQKLYYVEFDM
jgi:hypothetical protein